MSINSKNNLIKLISISILLAFIVIILGAYTRLTDAGLGCPDWPVCYGKIVVSKDIGNNNFGADWDFNSTKAWTEMIHRYVAGTLGLLVIICSLGTMIRKKAFLLPICLIAMIMFQALLGMWTVTLKLLPTVVMGHLLGGFITLSLLILLLLKHFIFDNELLYSNKTKILCFTTLIIVFCQIILGGWTSSNYAAIPCLDFPSCNNLYIPTYDTLSAMNPFVAIGPNYEGGLLSNAMRVTIQLFHRWGALITTIFMLLTCIDIRKYTPYKNNYYIKLSNFLILLLICQLSIGIINVKWALPLINAVMHNAVACILLISMVILNYRINYKVR